MTACPLAGSCATSRIGNGDVEPAAQVDVAVGLLLPALVARRAHRLDQPVLEQERAQLGLRRLVVDVLGLARPRGGRREVLARAGAQAHRLADVERAAVGVAEHVHARVLGQRGEVRPLRRRAPACSRPRPPRGAAAARAEQRHRLADRPRVGDEPREQRAEHARARLRVRQRAVGLRHVDARARRRARRARAASAAARSGAPSPPCTARAAAASPARPGRTRRAARRGRSARSARRAPARAAAGPARAAPPRAAARPSSIACVIPVKRWIPRPSGIETPTSELQRSCSSPPPTSTAPTSVSSQRSRASPFVSVSTARNSADASGCGEQGLGGEEHGRRTSGSYARLRTACTRGCRPSPGRRARV